MRAGTRINGRYRLSERIAVGGMGEVWRATDEGLGRSVAVKILRAELAEDEAFRKRFRAEARTAASLPHNGIAAVFDYGETTVGPDGVSPSADPVQGDGIAYLVMELVPGEALSAILTRGALGIERTLALLAQAARALHAAHAKGVIHRDVKPANLMVTPEGRVKVTDFGIARPVDHEPLTMTGQVMGTAHYLAPELARGLDASPLSDVYALGVVAYECLAGHRPFEGDNQVLVATAHLSQQPPPLPGTIPPDVVAAVDAAMEKDPADRVRSAELFAIALEKLLAHDPTALADIGGSRQDGTAHHRHVHSAQAPMIGPDGVAASRAGRHSAPPTAPSPASSSPIAGGLGAPPTRVTPGAADTVAAPRPGGWPSVPTAPQGLPATRRAGGGAAAGSRPPGPNTGRRRDGRPKISPTWLLIGGLLGVIVLVVVLIVATTEDPGGPVDVTDATPTSQVTGAQTPSLLPTTSQTGSLTPTGRKSSSRPSRSPSVAPSSGVPTSAPPSSGRPSSPAPSSPAPSSPGPTSPDPTTPPPTTPSVPVSPTASVPPPSSPAAGGLGAALVQEKP
ncbi:MAG: protein kinase [Kineosporiaceae bacterium]|nr:protein kinase [Kineosporiaceae bacterium]